MPRLSEIGCANGGDLFECPLAQILEQQPSSFRPAFAAMHAGKRIRPPVPRKTCQTRRTACLPRALRQDCRVVASLRQAAQDYAHFFPDIIVSMLNPNKSVSYLMQDRVANVLFGILKNIRGGQFDRSFTCLANPETAFAFV